MKMIFELNIINKKELCLLTFYILVINMCLNRGESVSKQSDIKTFKRQPFSCISTLKLKKKMIQRANRTELLEFIHPQGLFYFKQGKFYFNFLV